MTKRFENLRPRIDRRTTLKDEKYHNNLLLYVVHGIGERKGIFIQNWRNILPREYHDRVIIYGLEYPKSYKWLYLITKTGREPIVRKIVSDYDSAARFEANFTNVAILGYSNGTKVIAEIGNRLRDNIRKIAMLNAICTSDELRRLQFMQQGVDMRNIAIFCGINDIWPRVAALAIPEFFQDTGRLGTTTANCHVVWHQYDHYFALRPDYFFSKILPYLLDDVHFPSSDVDYVELSFWLNIKSILAGFGARYLRGILELFR